MINTAHSLTKGNLKALDWNYHKLPMKKLQSKHDKHNSQLQPLKQATEMKSIDGIT